MLTPGVLWWKNQPEMFKTFPMLVLGTSFCMLMILWHESLEVDHISNKKTGSLTKQLVEWYHQASCDNYKPPRGLSPDSCFPLSDFRSSSAFLWSDTGMGASVFGLQVKKPPARHQVILPHVASQQGFAALTCTKCLWAINHLQQFPERQNVYCTSFIMSWIDHMTFIIVQYV